jgi:hypothetical protein
MRGQATAFACLVAHQACPVRSARSAAPEKQRRLRRWLLGASAAAVLIPAIAELSEALAVQEAPPLSPLTSAPPFCGLRSNAYQIFHAVMNAGYSVRKKARTRQTGRRISLRAELIPWRDSTPPVRPCSIYISWALRSRRV